MSDLEDPAYTDVVACLEAIHAEATIARAILAVAHVRHSRVVARS